MKTDVRRVEPATYWRDVAQSVGHRHIAATAISKLKNKKRGILPPQGGLQIKNQQYILSPNGFAKHRGGVGIDDGYHEFLLKVSRGEK